MNPFYTYEWKKPIDVLPWWKRIIFWFLPTYAAIDSPYVTFYKVFRGVVYIVKMEEL